jgi:hypothetical protein
MPELDGDQLWLALKRRGLVRFTVRCDQCGKGTVVDLGRYPEFKMAARDAAERMSNHGDGSSKTDIE